MIGMPIQHQTSPALSRDVIQLKTLLQRERQIAEERLRALEHRDALLAAADTRRKTSHTDSARRKEDLSLAERRLNEERNKRAELQRIADDLTKAMEIYKQGHGDLRLKLLELIEKESWRINEHPRDIPEKSLTIDDLAPKEALALLSRLLEKLVLYTNTSTDRQRTELLERSRARQDMSNQRIEELESRSRVLEHDLRAAQEGRNDLESRLRLAESEKIQLKLEMDLARSELANERVTREQTIDMMKQAIEECRVEIASMQNEADTLRALCTSAEEREGHQRGQVEQLQQQLLTLSAQVDFCKKHHVLSSSQQASPLPHLRAPQTPEVDTVAPMSQSSEIMSTSAPSSRLEFPDPVIPPVSASQPAPPDPPRRQTRARKSPSNSASNSSNSNSALNSNSITAAPKAKAADTAKRRGGTNSEAPSAASSQVGRRRTRKAA